MFKEVIIINDKFEELFKAMHQFHKLRLGDIMPDISGADFWTMRNIMDKGEDGKITISELAKKTRVLPSAISRTLKRLEEKGYVERTVNKNDRRNTYVEITDRGREVAQEVREIMRDYGEAVLSKFDEEELSMLISYLNNIYDIAKKEIEVKRLRNRKLRKDRKNG